LDGTVGVVENLAAVRRRIEVACDATGRDPASVRLVAVSKTRRAAEIEAAYRAGQRDFAENRVQELVSKAADLAGLADLRWSMIGHVQTNKAADVAATSDEVQSLDSLRLARALDRRLADLDRTLRVLVQVNTSGEESKTGLAPDEVLGFVRELETCPQLKPYGLMTIAANSTDPERVSGCFRTLADLRGQVQDLTGRAWPELSMGMSGDLEIAIAAGSTCVRVGTAIFGSRS
jgi:pyridoxal phosphate enzyme (YggS family)